MGCIRTPECAMNHELEIADVIEKTIGTDSDTFFSLSEEYQEELGYEEEEEEEEEEYEEEEEEEEKSDEAGYEAGYEEEE